MHERAATSLNSRTGVSIVNTSVMMLATLP